MAKCSLTNCMFLDRFPHYAWTAAQSAHSDFVGSRVYVCLGVTCNLHFWQNDRGLLHAPVVTWGWNGHLIRVSTQINSGEKNSPTAPVKIRTHNLLITSPALYQQAILTPRFHVQSTIYHLKQFCGKCENLPQNNGKCYTLTAVGLRFCYQCKGPTGPVPVPKH